ncbi:PREDICTED: ecto-ADP-ribosyltransferase 3 [Condylura cristata]|uniref:ecto-ADP-ribosyltransferase 3 n=1 Tax=Condylura cristata TaxID=143302 RepID=UPI00064381D1|nr:PREDICTED: ecto-ADP-ribosyltransferase 3 [Condylura cristata]XP_012579591.1 PREDICTED: ecto-ADP-ribosyltransferase 3 [Condylura cristata]XP_012579592.1 PREDICTED: ecto-ADP-ribosyltransferase 3 [Condylura cristata]XP_012579593.1 PREDICTED: ecto-ADP-ribosyltransferase 3 [Condylura cristata]
MKTGHFEMVSMLLAAMILMDIFQVKAEMLDMADNAFDDEYLKCTDRMEIKYIPQLLKEEKANQQLLVDVWEDAASKWEARKTKMVLPVNFKDNHGIALMAYISEAQKQTEFYHLFNKAVKMAGQSRKDYIYDFQFKAFHFYLTKALQLLRKPCEESYKNVVYSSSQVAFIFGGLNQVRFGNFTLAYATKPQPANDQHILLTIHTCFGIAVEKFFDDEDEKIVLIPLNEVFHVSQDVTGNNLILQSTNKTCSHYECAFLGGLKTSGCVENMEYFQPIYVYNPGEKNQKLEDSGMKKQESTNFPGMKSYDSTQIPAPRPGPDPVPGPKTHPSASSGQTLLPPFGTVVILFSASAMLLHSPVA